MNNVADTILVFCVSIVLLFGSVVFAQPVLDSRFDLSPVNGFEVGSQLIIEDDTIYTLGGGNLLSGNWSFILFKSTLGGDPVDTTYFDYPGLQFNTPGLTSKGDTIIVFGSVIEDTVGWDPCIILFDKSLDSIEYIKYDTTKHITILSGTWTNDGGFIMFGSIQDSAGGTSWPDLYLIRLDSDFNKLWDKKLVQSYYASPRSISNWGDGFLVSGHRYNAAVWEDTHELFAMQLDSNGDLLSSKTITESHGIQIGRSILDGEKIYLAGVASDTANTVHNVHFRKPRLITLDTSFNVLNETTFGDYGTQVYSWLPYGLLVDDQRVYMYGFEYPQGFITAFTLEGDYLWKINYSDTIVASDQSISHLIARNSNEFFGIGYKGDLLAGPDDRDHWLFRVDSLGCMVADCNNYANVYGLDNLDIKIYPNPTNDRVVIESGKAEILSGEIRLFDLSGHLIKHIQIEGAEKIEIILDKIQAGTYILHFEGPKQLFQAKLIVK
ncbi:MAG: T9SS type A sorting domain-containing protein [Crocinitomicaceae bacterium]|nr:T9SS type A sorting domain-containing protein [Crocinitomicaceae bacterium]